MKMIILNPCIFASEKHLYDGNEFISFKKLNEWKQDKEKEGYKVLIDITNISNPSEWYI